VLFNLIAVIFSHRIAGPLYRLQRHLKAVAAGAEPGDVKFRRGDLYQELAEACNELMARMRGSATKP
jgi:nitrogen fixation/metabolism regulation signal transduction histidine kinase